MEAEAALKNLDLWRIPVDPFEVARKEGIELLPGEFSDGFDGRIRFIKEISCFAISYRRTGFRRSEGRVRFTLAHELGHYYLHRKYLLTGECHSSVTNFVSKDQMEVEADKFAAALLMPMELFRKRINVLRSRVADLSDLVKLANNEFQTSITSTVRRYCTSDVEPCGAIFSRDGIVQWCHFSEDMRLSGMGYYPFGSQLPGESITVGKLAQSTGGEIVSGAVKPLKWFDNPRHDGYLWEEAMPLGNTGLVLTYLTLQ